MRCVKPWAIYVAIVALCAGANLLLVSKQDWPTPEPVARYVPPTKEAHLAQRRAWEAQHMPDTGWQFPTGMSQLAENSNDWTGETNINVDDGTYARSDVELLEASCTLRATFSLTVPAGATILGVEVRYEVKKQDPSVYTGYLTQLTKAGTPQGDNKYDNGNIPNTDTLYTKGGAADLWNVSLSQSDFSADNIGVDLRFYNTGVDYGFVYVDYVQMRVTYSEVTLGTGDGTLPGMQGSGQGKVIGSASGTLPGLQGSSQSKVIGVASGTLPGLQGSSQAKVIGTSDATLPGLTGKAHYRVN